MPGFLHFGKTLTNSDTRIEARNWIERNIPIGTRIYSPTYFYYALPPLPPGYKYVKPGGDKLEIPDNVDWIVVDSHPICLYNRS